MHNESIVEQIDAPEILKSSRKEKVINTALMGAIFVAPVVIGVGGSILGWKQTKMNLEAAKLNLEAAKLNNLS